MKQTKRIIIIEAAALIALIITIAVSGIKSFANEYKDITKNVFRLHILANSDSEADQTLKLQVRDEILKQTSSIYENCTDIAEAEALTNANLALFEGIAESVIYENGYDYGVKASVENTDFDTRVYNEITMPEGAYTALRIEIGAAEGKNWWCVMFPPLCLPAVTADEEAIEVFNGVLTENEQDILLNPKKYEADFYFLKIWRKFINLFKN
jgi:stage II sporulation protein R